jgi:hypothetical protein
MKKWLGCLGLCAAALLSACGGGGGSSGNTQEQYSITLRADQTSLPLNVSGYPAGVGVNYPYSTTLYVNVKEGNDTVQDGAAVSCNMAGGLSSGALYYFDGDTSHQTSTTDPTTGATTTVENAYRSIALTTSSGGASFHFSAANIAGTSTITCSVTDPRDSRVYSASVNIKVGAATGLPASMQLITQTPQNMGVQGNLSGLQTSVAIQAIVRDEANQPVPNSSKPNLQVSILSGGGAESGARLQSSTGDSNTSIQINTSSGVGLFTLASGKNTGFILLELQADRYDNDVSNGVRDPVVLRFAVQVVDGTSSTETPIQIDPNTTQCTVTEGAPSVCRLQATGGKAPYTWTASGSWPAGLSFSADGIISGAAQTVGTFPARVSVSDSSSPGNTADAVVIITITPSTQQSLSITNTSLSAIANTPLSYALSATGGVQPLTWTALGPLPAGLALSSDGIITGTPTAAGSYTVSVKVTDSNGTSATANLSITIQAVPALSITATSVSAAVNTPLSYALSATGGVAPFTWTALGSLPAGLTLSSDGVISGTPAAAGGYTVSVKVTDSRGVSATANLSVTIQATPNLAITTTAINAVANTPMSYAMLVTGGVQPLTWEALGPLPPGLALSGAGILSGTPTTAGTYAVSVKVTDSKNASATANLSITIQALGQLAITTTAVNAVVDRPLSYTLTATGGQSPLTWTVLGNPLPSNLTLSDSGILTGTPKATGVYSVAVKVTDDKGASATANLSITIGTPGLSITTTSISMPVNTPLTYAMSVTGGTSPYTWVEPAGGTLLPNLGLTLSPTGIISGTPTKIGTNLIAIQVTDAKGISVIGNLSLEITAPN